MSALLRLMPGTLSLAAMSISQRRGMRASSSLSSRRDASLSPLRAAQSSASATRVPEEPEASENPSARMLFAAWYDETSAVRITNE